MKKNIQSYVMAFDNLLSYYIMPTIYEVVKSKSVLSKQYIMIYNKGVGSDDIKELRKTIVSYYSYLDKISRPKEWLDRDNDFRDKFEDKLAEYIINLAEFKDFDIDEYEIEDMIDTINADIHSHFISNDNYTD